MFVGKNGLAGVVWSCFCTRITISAIRSSNFYGIKIVQILLCELYICTV